jgi:hypothetical protein
MLSSLASTPAISPSPRIAGDAQLGGTHDLDRRAQQHKTHRDPRRLQVYNR